MSQPSKSARAAKFLAENWDRNATIDPFYTVLSDDRKKGGGWREDEFFQTGEQVITDVAATLRERGLELHGSRAMDFGCGLGRLTQALAPYFDEVVGVDASKVMLEKASALSKRSNVSYVLNAEPDLRQFPDASFDFILSQITLQHTGRTLAESYLAEFGRLLSPGGVASIQVPTGFKSIKGFLGAILPDSVLEFFMMRKQGLFFTMTYPIHSDRVAELVRSGGCRILSVIPANVNRGFVVQSFLFTKPSIHGPSRTKGGQ